MINILYFSHHQSCLTFPTTYLLSSFICILTRCQQEIREADEDAGSGEDGGGGGSGCLQRRVAAAYTAAAHSTKNRG